MSSPNWDLVQQLAQEFFNVQQQSCSVRLSERNWIEIINCVLKVHNMTVIYTKDGKEMVTPEQLLNELKMFLDMHDGRASFSEMQDGLGVDYAVIEERCMELVRRSGASSTPTRSDEPVWHCWRVLDQIVTNNYCERLTAEIESELETVGRINVGALATRFQLPAEFVRKLLPDQSKQSAVGSVVDGDVIYSANFIRRAMCRLVGFLSSSVRPQRVSAFAQQTGLPERLVTTVMDNAISLGRLSGSVQQKMYVPKVFTKAQQECIKSALTAVYIDASVLRRLGIVGDVCDVIRKEWGPLDEPESVGNSGFIRKSAVDRLNTAIEDACKRDEASSVGWLDVDGAAAALGGSDGSIPQDVVEKLICSRRRLMEIIDCQAFSMEKEKSGGKGKESDSSDGENNSDGEGGDLNDTAAGEDCGLVAVAPWLIEKTADALYHILVTKINERKQQALSVTPAVLLTPNMGDAPGTPSPESQGLSLAATPTVETTSTPSGSKRKQAGRGSGNKGNKAASASTGAPVVPMMYRVSKRRLVRLFCKNREKLVSADFPSGAIQPFIYQHVHTIVSRRLAELAAMTPKSSAVATATSAKQLQQASSAGGGAATVEQLSTELPRLVVTLASCWRGVTQHLLPGMGGTIDRDRRAMSAHLRETLSPQIVELLRLLPFTSKDAVSGHGAELLSESIATFERSFTSNDVENAIEALKQLFGLSFARNALNSVGVSANALGATLATALPSASEKTGRAKGSGKSSNQASSLGITVEQLRADHLAAGTAKLQQMIPDESATADPLLLPNVLLLVASLTFERVTGELISCPGRLVPTLVNFLATNANTDKDVSPLLTRALTISQKQLRAGSKPVSVPAEQKSLINDLVAVVDTKDKN